MENGFEQSQIIPEISPHSEIFNVISVACFYRILYLKKKKNKNLFLPTLFSHMWSKQKLHDKMRIAILHVGLYY